MLRPAIYTGQLDALYLALLKSYRVDVTEKLAEKPTDELAEELMQGITGIRRVVRRRLRASLAVPELTGSQTELLRAVEASPGTGVAAAARAMHLAGNSVSQLVNQLVDAGLLSRATDPADRRAVRLHLTEAALVRLSAWRTERGKLVGAALAELPAADRAALEAALPALHRLAAVLAEEEGDDA
jgi:DNA-binding MarR family transcriptional regulator